MTGQARPAVSPTAMQVSWTWARFDALTGGDVYDALALRSAVFVVEQDCAFLDADGCDRAGWHLLGRIATDGDANGNANGNAGQAASLVAYLRCLDPGVKYQDPSIGRVIVAAPWRASGLGRALMREGIARTQAQWRGADIVIGAQLRLEAFYASLGFRGTGAPYLEDGIDHVEMRLRCGREPGEKRR